MPGWRRILCPVDFSDLSHEAMAEAVALASKVEGTVHLLHVVEPVPGAHRGEGMSAGRSLEDLVEQAQGTLERWRGEAEALLPGRVTAEVTAAGGEPAADDVARAAGDGGYDLVVMGTHGRRGIRRLVVGSVAEGVVRGAPCSVLVVRPRGRGGP